MPHKFFQANRPLVVSACPLGKDTLLAVGLSGGEELSRLYEFTLEAKAELATPVPFDGLLGKKLSVRLTLPVAGYRYFSGVCARVEQGESDSEFTSYQLALVPEFWRLTKKAQSRVFQHLSVPDILKVVLAGLDVAYDLRGTYEPRDYCAQYRETDFNFASRLMEEEGIYYYFRHADGGVATMAVADTPKGHKPVPGAPDVVYKNASKDGSPDQDYVHELAKIQHQAAGRFELRDHTFELPHGANDAAQAITPTAAVGKITHKLQAGDAGKLEVYDWPGEYAQRFDGIDKMGGEQPAEPGKIADDKTRVVGLRMQAEAAAGVLVRGAGAARQMTTGHTFTLHTLPKDYVAAPLKAEGDYVLTRVTHTIYLPANYRSGSRGGGGFRYANTFEAIPLELPFRPARRTPKPVVAGTQSAVVVGPGDEEIFTDKYGRVKVKFHWDRDPTKGADASCWLRVCTPWAGRGWGALHIPRVGQEVIVDFLEGDPDQPVVVGSVYNPDQMPRYTLPDEKTKSYIRSNSSPDGDGYNEIRLEDKANKEQVYIHAQRNMDERVRNDSMERVGNNRHLRVGFYLEKDHQGDTGGETKKGNQFEEVAVDQHLKVHRNKEEHIGGDYKLLVGGVDGPGNVDVHIKKAKAELIDATSDLHVKQAVTELYDATYDQHVKADVTQTFDAKHDLHVKGARAEQIDGASGLTVGGGRAEKVGGDLSVDVGMNYQQKAGMKHAVDAGMEIHLKAGMNVTLEAGVNLTLKVGGNFVSITPAGVAIQGVMVLINSGGAAGSGSGASPDSPAAPAAAKAAKDAKDANPTKPTDADFSKTGAKSN